MLDEFSFGAREVMLVLGGKTPKIRCARIRFTGLRGFSRWSGGMIGSDRGSLRDHDLTLIVMPYGRQEASSCNYRRTGLASTGRPFRLQSASVLVTES